MVEPGSALKSAEKNASQVMVDISANGEHVVVVPAEESAKKVEASPAANRI